MSRKANPFFVVCVVVPAVILAIIALFLYRSAQVAAVVDDEAARDIREASPQMKVIVEADGTVARYVSEDESTYTGDIQDTYTVGKENARVETWRACDGKGTVYLKEEGESPAYAEPDSSSQIVGKLIYDYGCCPETYDCLGYGDGWFKISLGGDTSAYINEKYVSWDAIDTF